MLIKEGLNDHKKDCLVGDSLFIIVAIKIISPG